MSSNDYVRGVQDAVGLIEQAAGSAPTWSDATLLKTVASKVANLVGRGSRRRESQRQRDALRVFVDGIARKVVHGAASDIELSQERLSRDPGCREQRTVVANVLLNPAETQAWVDYAAAVDVEGATEVQQEIQRRQREVRVEGCRLEFPRVRKP